VKAVLEIKAFPLIQREILRFSYKAFSISSPNAALLWSPPLKREKGTLIHLLYLLFCIRISVQSVTHTTEVRACSNTETSGYTRPTTFFKYGHLLLFFFFPPSLECQDHGLGNSNMQRMKKKKHIRKPALL